MLKNFSYLVMVFCLFGLSLSAQAGTCTIDKLAQWGGIYALEFARPSNHYTYESARNDAKVRLSKFCSGLPWDTIVNYAEKYVEPRRLKTLGTNPISFSNHMEYLASSIAKTGALALQHCPNLYGNVLEDCLSENICQIVICKN